MSQSWVPRSVRPFLDPIRQLPPRLELLAFLLVVSESIIFYVFAGSLLATIETPHQPLSFLLILVLLWFSRAVPHLLNTVRIWDSRYQFIMGSAILLSAVVVVKVGAFPDYRLFSLTWIQEAGQSLIFRESAAVRQVWMLIGLVVLAWWRGRSRAEPSLETTYSMLRLGLIWLAGGAILTLMVGQETLLITEYLTPALVGFVVISLISVAVARQPDFDYPAAPQTGWVWALILIVPTLIIAGFATSATGVLTRDTLDLLVTVVTPVFWALQYLVQALVLTIALIAFLLISPIIWLLERQGFEPMANFPEIDISPGAGFDANESASTGLTVDDPVRFLIVGIILLLIMFLLVRYLFRRRQRWEQQDDPQDESLIDWNQTRPAFLARIRNWVSDTFGRRDDDLPAGPEWEGTRRIRKVYRLFLKQNAKSDQARNPHETPDRYARRLGQHSPADLPEIEQITASYDQARYSGRPASPDVAERTETTWKLLNARNKSST